MMKKLSTIAGVLGALAFLMAGPSWAQSQAPSEAPPAVHGKHAFGKHHRMYNPQAVETVAGKVVSVKRRTARRPGRPAHVTMKLKTDQGTFRVALGPADYLDQQALKLGVGDQVEVKGMKVTHRNRTFFVAGEVKKGEQVLKLRDAATGRPLWATGKKPKGADIK